MAYLRSSSSLWWLSGALLWLVGGLPASGCGEEPAAPCAGPRPSFELTLQAETGHLPADTVLTVNYGGGEEQYSLANPEQLGQVVFCSRQPAGSGGQGAGGSGGFPGAGAAGAPSAPARVESLRCELWTDGAATVRVETEEFPLLEEELLAETEDRCVVTVQVELELRQEHDAGTD